MPTISVGMRSGVNWMRRNSRPRIFPSVETSSVLAEAGHADNEAVALAEEGGEHQFDDALLPDDDAGGLVADELHLAAGLFPGSGGIGGGFWHGGFFGLKGRGYLGWFGVGVFLHDDCIPHHGKWAARTGPAWVQAWNCFSKFQGLLDTPERSSSEASSEVSLP